MSLAGETRGESVTDRSANRARRIPLHDRVLLDVARDCLNRLSSPTGSDEFVAEVTALAQRFTGLDDVAIGLQDDGTWSITGARGLDEDAAVLIGLLESALDIAAVLEEERANARSAREEVDVLEKVALEILSVRDLDRALNVATDEILRLLDADMAAVMLRDGDDVILRSCAGNLTAQVLRVRYHPGEGLAGRILEEGRSLKVDDYFDNSNLISSHFMELARSERIVTALGAPLRRGGETLGVLEVWRREPRPFDEADVRRLEAVANLVMIAIENARLYEAQQASMEQLGCAQGSLERQMALLERSAAIQRDLIEALLEGQGLSALVRTVNHLVGCGVVIFTADGGATVFHPPELDVEPVVDAARALVAEPTFAGGSAQVRTANGDWLAMQRIQAGADALGWVCLVTEDEPDDGIHLTLGQTAVTVALARLEASAASRARAELRDDVLWDLLCGPPDHRHAAIDRGKRLGVDVAQPQRVFAFQLHDLTEHPAPENWDPRHYETVRSRIRSIVEHSLTADGRSPLVGLRGELVLALVPSDPKKEDAHLRAERLVQELDAYVPDMISPLGISSITDIPMEYAAAYQEARLAQLAAEQLQREYAVFDDLGVMQLLLSSRREADLGGFVERTLGPVLAYEQQRATPFIETLRTYFQADCNMKEAAGRLFVHPKTLRYRLRRVEELTGLSLDHHEDRVSADLALKVYDLMHNRDGEHSGADS